jgi:nicotinamide mononucleotide transporter
MVELFAWFLMDWIWLEFVGGAITIACVYALAKNYAGWGWILGIGSAALYIVLFFNSAIFAETAINVYYLVTCVWGLILWKGYGDRIREALNLTDISNRLRNRMGLPPAGNTEPVPITRITPKLLVGTVLAVAALTALGTFVLGFTVTTVPFLDSLTTSLAIAAQFLLAKKVYENWHVWIIADVFYVVMFTYKALYITAGVYFILLLVCVKALYEWRDIRADEQRVSAPQQMAVV